MIKSPIGRLVQGDVFTMQTKDKAGQPLVVKTGANKGQPTQRAFIAIAVPKQLQDTRPGSPTHGQMVDNWEFAEYYAQLYAEARQSYPQLFTSADGRCSHPRFAWKFSDGDGVDSS